MPELKDTQSDPPVNQDRGLASHALGATLLLFVLPAALILPTSFRSQSWELVILSLIAVVLVEAAQRIKPLPLAYRLKNRSEAWLKRIDRAFALRTPVLYSGWLTDLADTLHIQSVIKLIPTILSSLCAPAHFYTRLTKIVNGHTPLLRPIPFLTVNFVVAAIVYWFISVEELKEFYSAAARPLFSSTPIMLILLYMLRPLSHITSKFCSPLTRDYVALKSFKLVPLELGKEYKQATFAWSFVYFFVGLLYALAVVRLSAFIADYLWYISKPLLTGFGAIILWNLVVGVPVIILVVRPFLCHVIAPLSPLCHSSLPSFSKRFFRIALLNIKALREVLSDPAATVPALAIVGLASILFVFNASPVAGLLAMDEPLSMRIAKAIGFLSGASIMLLEGWLLTVGVASWIAVVFFGARERTDTVKQLIRGLGFAYSNFVLFGSLAYIDLLRDAVSVLTLIAYLTLFIIVIRQVLEIPTWKAIIVFLTAVIVNLVYSQVILVRIFLQLFHKD